MIKPLTNDKKTDKKQHGFTLTELVIVIVILGIISTVVTPLISNKFSAVSQSATRASWVQSAEFALFHLRQDLAQSVPNSVKTSEANQVVEFLTTNAEADVYAARYRNRQYNPYDRLQANGDNSFDLFGSFTNVPSFISVGAANATDLWTDWENLRAGNSTGSVANVISSTVSSGENSSPITNIVLTNSGNHDFGNHSPYYRAYFTDGPVGYFCDTANNQLLRVRNYTDLSAASFAVRTAAAVEDRIIDNLISCEFSLSSSSVYLPPTLRIALEIGAGGESIQLIDTIQLSNGS